MSSWGDGDWVVMIACGIRFLGQIHGVRVEPVYEVALVPQQTPDGQQGMVVMAGPPMMMPGIKGIDIPTGAIIIPVKSLEKEERRSFAQAAEQAAKTTQAIRAARAGIVIAGSVPPRTQ